MELRAAYQVEHPDIKLPPGPLTSTTVTIHGWVELTGRPSWRRKLVAGGDFEVLSAASTTPAQRELRPEVARVSEIFVHAPVPEEDPVTWVRVSWFSDTENVEPVSKCPVYERRDGPSGGPPWNRYFAPASLIRPVHMLHMCDQACRDGGIETLLRGDGNTGIDTRGTQKLLHFLNLGNL